jgi:hypothetical protein
VDLHPRALFDNLCTDIGCFGNTGNPFDPYPDGKPCDSELSSSPREHARVALIGSLLKKYEDQTDENARSETFRAFVSANEHCRDYVFPEIDDPALGFALAESKRYLRDWLTPSFEAIFTDMAIASEAMFGPGASSGIKSKGTNLYYKVGASRITASDESLIEQYWYDCSKNETCAMAEKARFNRFGAAIVDSGRLDFVPKSYYKERTILVEPSLNTYYQLGIGSLIEDVLRRRTGVDLSCQSERNARLARQGSIDGSYATVDLKACSDYQSLTMVRAQCPKPFVDKLERYRTPKVTCDLFSYEDTLHMVSTMGNGFTFPLQTIILASVIFGVYKTLDIKIERPSLVTDGNFGVFGDDIVVVNHTYPLLCKTLEALGYVVNKEKSFADGSFRESCGSDWFAGTNIRGVYIRSLRTKQDVISAINRLNMWSAQHGIRLRRTIQYLTRALNGFVPAVPPDESVSAGLYVLDPHGFLPRNYDRNHSWRYTFFEARPRFLTGKQLRKGQAKKYLQTIHQHDGYVNKWALYKAFLAGHLRNSKFSLREDRISYEVRSKVTPNWGSLTGPHPLLDEDAYRRWKRLCEWTWLIRSEPM